MLKKDNVKISVIIPTFNAEPYIQQALASVINQTEHDLEVIVCDDHSTDNTVALVEGMVKNDGRIKLIKNEQNQGPSFSRNHAISEAKGKWIALLDADDYYHKNRLKELIKIAEEYNADLVADNIYYVNENGENPTPAFSTAENSSQQEVLSTNSFIQSDLPGVSSFKYGYLKPIIRKSFLHTHHIQYDETTRLGEDILLYVECLLNGAIFVLCKNAFYYYRFVSSSISRTGGEKTFFELRNNNSKLIKIAENTDNKDAVHLLQYRQKLFDHVVLYSEIYNHLQHHQVVAALKKLILHPTAWFFCFKMALDFIKQKMKK